MLLALLALAVWVYLATAHGRFWSSLPELGQVPPATGAAVDVIVPARDEADTIERVIASLRSQDYRGEFKITLVDDNSSDDTAALAARAGGIDVLRLADKPAGWSGKLWALSQGVAATRAPLILFADADIVHHPGHLSSLVAKLDCDSRDMVSEMVRLHCVSTAEKALIPAFVYFFQMLYPFSRVNSRSSRVAAAAGGTILIRREILKRVGGMETIRHTLIDDVALATEVKRKGAIYLGHSGLASSIRLYPRWRDIWQMVARTAFTQLRFSTALLVATVLAMMLIWLVPPLVAIFGTGAPRWIGIATCAIAAATYQPTLARFRCNPAWAALLPLIALFYLGATMDSARQHWLGRGANWKSRSYD